MRTEEQIPCASVCLFLRFWPSWAFIIWRFHGLLDTSIKCSRLVCAMCMSLEGWCSHMLHEIDLVAWKCALP